LCSAHAAPTSNHVLTPLSKALGFMQGLRCGARRLTQVAYLRRDALVPRQAARADDEVVD
jgi:hypothetical protein